MTYEEITNNRRRQFKCGSQPAVAAMHGPHRFLILVTVQLYTVMTEVCRRLINGKQRKTDICSTNQ